MGISRPMQYGLPKKKPSKELSLFEYCMLGIGVIFMFIMVMLIAILEGGEDHDPDERR